MYEVIDDWDGIDQSFYDKILSAESNLNYRHHYATDEGGAMFFSHIIQPRIEKTEGIPVPCSRLYFDVFRMTYDLCRDKGIPFVGIGRAGINLTYATSQPSQKHIDHDYPHIQIIYYLNDSDGDTVLFMGNDEARITPKKNRILIFDGQIEHQGLPPSIDRRHVLVCTVLVPSSQVGYPMPFAI